MHPKVPMYMYVDILRRFGRWVHSYKLISKYKRRKIICTIIGIYVNLHLSRDICTLLHKQMHDHTEVCAERK